LAAGFGLEGQSEEDRRPRRLKPALQAEARATFHQEFTPEAKKPPSTARHWPVMKLAPTLNSDGSVKSYNGFGVITSTTSTARVLQVGATLRF
jgi:hypothetical protein